MELIFVVNEEVSHFKPFKDQILKEIAQLAHQPVLRQHRSRTLSAMQINLDVQSQTSSSWNQVICLTYQMDTKSRSLMTSFFWLFLKIPLIIYQYKRQKLPLVNHAWAQKCRRMMDPFICLSLIKIRLNAQKYKDSLMIQGSLVLAIFRYLNTIYRRLLS